MNNIKQWIMSGIASVLFIVLSWVGTVMWNKIEAGDTISQEHYKQDAAIQATLQAHQEEIRRNTDDTNARVKNIDEKLDKLLEQKVRNAR